MRSPSLKFLKTFHIAATRLSFKAAAAELFITPSAVSHQIRTLEEQLGVTLFQRAPRSLSLTEAGADYLRQIDSLFHRLESVTEQLQVRFGRAIARLHAPPFFASELLFDRLKTFLEASPETDIHVDTIAASLDEHPAEADLAIVVGNGPWEGFEAHRLFAQRFTPACAPLLMDRARIRVPADLNQTTLIVLGARRDLWDRWSEANALAPLKPRKILRVDTMFAAVEAAERALGVALVSTPLGSKRFGSGTLVRPFGTELDSGDSYFLLQRPVLAPRGEVEALKQWLLEEFRRDE
jgi:LysR family glycine cleavage system transcriptional activator